MFDFTNKVIIVTGAAGAVGSTVAKMLDNAGATTILLDVSAKRLEKVKASLSKNVNSYQVDLTDKKQVKDTVSKVISEYEKIDGCVNIAGGFIMNDITHDLDLQVMDKMINMNVKSMVTLSKYVLKHMKTKNSGAIVNFGARAGLEGKARMGPYTGAKSMVMRITESMAKEYLQFNININCILPGTIDTERNRRDMPNADHSLWVKPENIGNVVMFLLLQKYSTAVTGALIPVYGKTL